MKRSSIMALAMLLLPALAGSQPASITLADLEGAIVEARVTMDQIIEREGRQFPTRTHQVTTITFNSGGRIEWSSVSTSDTPRGQRQGPVRSGKTTLGKARDSKFLGGGQAVWFFEDNALISLRTFADAGGFKRTVSFTLKDGVISCTANEAHVREEGVGGISFRSAIDDAPIVIISSKQSSSSCKVTPKKSEAN
jgi:hypothetical protein